MPVPFGSIVGISISGVGLMAAAIAVCGFLAHAVPAIAGRDEDELRRLTAFGGLVGFAASLFIIALSLAGA